MDSEPTSLASTRPYLIRALHEWCSDSGFTPYIVVRVDDTVQVPREYVNNGEIVLNVSHDATSALNISNEYITFKARFGGRPCDIAVPVGRVVAIYARENGQGMAFSAEEGDVASPGEGLAVAVDKAPESDNGAATLQSVKVADRADGDAPVPRPPAGRGRRPALKRIK